MKSFAHTFERRFRDHIEKYDLLRPSDIVLLAVSGGMDSMTLLHLFLPLRVELGLNVEVIHVNHQIRGEEANEDERFVQTIAKLAGLPFHSRSVQTSSFAAERGISLQEAARALRYDAFEDVRCEINAQSVATAHNTDDNAETVLMNILRGTGLRGLSGIPVKRENGQIIRPLLFARRSEIEAYVREVGIEFRHDSSNDSNDYTRNFIRNRVIPFIQTSTPNDIISSLNNISEAIRSVRTLVLPDVQLGYDQTVTEGIEGDISLDIQKLTGLPPYIQEEIILKILDRMSVEPTRDKIDGLLSLHSKQTGKTFNLSGSVSAYRDRDRLIFHNQANIQRIDVAVELEREYDFDWFRFSVTSCPSEPQTVGVNKYMEFVDGGRLGKNLKLRTWNEGDSFVPLGMKTPKKLSDFFIDEKISRHTKNHIPVFESDGEIVWVCGMRLDDRFKLTPMTTSFVQLNYQPRKTG